ncbi:MULTISPECIES: low molecular weight protein-tyrosine-phosphatase [unclassified Brevibacterium]|uniref:low molecular weight protein-tyrosine-phosphatase n=1 Tax=unclassified Brevibacterium TaxID=2614124 RepID=UPI001092BBEB|nr:low molecular weight protein-tyrosine-phosphatase [Brevibacterium sp. S22]TGD29378.1 low molecular weight phosphotyrosine protein phosphatase [Brevibacterium sp. S22]
MSMASVVFVCTGNICRSVTAERVLEHHLAETGTEAVIDSAGISDEEAGNPIDPRQARVLAAAGYRTDDHVARQITPEWLTGRDLAVAMTARHYRALQRMIADLPAEAAPELRMLRELDPRVGCDRQGAGAEGTAVGADEGRAASASGDEIPAPDVEDPWYGEFKDFEETLETIEVSVPGITDHLRALAAKTQ